MANGSSELDVWLQAQPDFDNMQDMSFRYDFNLKTLEGLSLPSGLQSLTIGAQFQLPEGVTLPSKWSSKSVALRDIGQHLVIFRARKELRLSGQIADSWIPIVLGFCW